MNKMEVITIGNRILACTKRCDDSVIEEVYKQIDALDPGDYVEVSVKQNLLILLELRLLSLSVERVHDSVVDYGHWEGA